jgi:hypothetical protein
LTEGINKHFLNCI